MLHSRKHVNQILQTLEASIEGIEHRGGCPLHAKVFADDFHPSSMSLSGMFDGFTEIAEVAYNTETGKYVLKVLTGNPGTKKTTWVTSDNLETKGQVSNVLVDHLQMKRFSV